MTTIQYDAIILGSGQAGNPLATEQPFYHFELVRANMTGQTLPCSLEKAVVM